MSAAAGGPAESEFVPLSQSPLFTYQRRFYEESGLDAWQGGAVPSFITSNAFVAQRYADVILSSWQDALPSRDSEAGAYLLELGAGSGKLGFSLLRHLLPRAEALFGRAFALRIRYIMTDSAESVVRGWMAHPQLRELARAGFLDFAVLDSGDEDWAVRGLRLQHSGSVLPPLSARGDDSRSVLPTVVIANYVLDSLPCDVWQVLRGGSSDSGAPRQADALLQGLVRVTHASSSAATPTRSAAAFISEFEAEWRMDPVNAAATARDTEAATCCGGPAGEVSADEPAHSAAPAAVGSDGHGGSCARGHCWCCCSGQAGGVSHYSKAWASPPRNLVGDGTGEAGGAGGGRCGTVAATQRAARHSAAMQRLSAASLDGVLAWYRKHACDSDMHAAFAPELACPRLPVDSAGSAENGEGEDEEEAGEGAITCSGGGVASSTAASELLQSLQQQSGSARGVAGLWAEQSKLLTCLSCGGTPQASWQPITDDTASPPAAPPSAVPPPAPVSATSSTFTLPSGAMQCLARLFAFTTAAAGTDPAAAVGSARGEARSGLSGGGLLLLVGDKGLLNPFSFVGAGIPDIHRHGSFSTMLNFHATALWAQVFAAAVEAGGALLRGGDPLAGAAALAAPAPPACRALVSPDDDVNLKTCVLALCPKQQRLADLRRDMPATADAWLRCLCAFGPSELYDLFHALSRAVPAPLLAYRFDDSDRRFARAPAGGPTEPPSAAAAGERGARSRSGGSAPRPGRHQRSVRQQRRQRRDTRTGRATAHTSASGHISGAAGEPGESLLLCSDSESNSEASAPEQPSLHSSDADSAASTHARSSPPVAAAATATAAVSRRTRAPRSAAAALHASFAHRFLSLRSAVALCRLCCWDGDVVHAFRDVFAARLPHLTPPRRFSLWAGLRDSWVGYFRPLMPPSLAAAGATGAATSVPARAEDSAFAAGRRSRLAEYDVAFDVGRILHLNGELAAAQSWYVASLRAVDASSAVTAFNLGLCCEALGQPAFAAAWWQRAVALSGGRHAAARRALHQEGSGRVGARTPTHSSSGSSALACSPRGGGETEDESEDEQLALSASLVNGRRADSSDGSAAAPEASLSLPSFRNVRMFAASALGT